MEIMTGSLYFVSDEFFAKIQDPYLKINYENTKRPHYFAFRDSITGLYWLVPCSSKIEKIPETSHGILLLLTSLRFFFFNGPCPVTKAFPKSPFPQTGPWLPLCAETPHCSPAPLSRSGHSRSARQSLSRCKPDLTKAPPSPPSF